MKSSDAIEASERLRMDRDALRQEVEKLKENWSSFKEEASGKFENYSR